MSFVIAGNSASTGYNLTRSLRFRASASGYLNRTPSVAGNRQTWTYSVWAKLGAAVGTSNYNILMARTSASYYTGIYFNANNLYLDWYNSSQIALVRSSQVFRDPSAWYHIVIAVNTTSATSSNRILMYVNGTQVTAFTTATYPPQNAQTAGINEASIATWISSDPAYPAQGYYDGYLAEVNFIDGQALTPSSFGSTNALTGVWQPARYTGSYGTNGFYLNFTDNSALTTSSNVGLGKDFSGNGNYWTTNNISITAGVTYDSMTDVPTLTSATAANFATLNPLQLPSATLSNGNLTASGGQAFSISTIGMSSGKFYAEMTVTTVGGESSCGISQGGYTTQTGTAVGTTLNGGATAYGYLNDGSKFSNGVNPAYGSSYTSGDVIGIAFDATAGTLTFYKNNVSQGSAYTGLTSGPYFFAVEGRAAGGTNNCSINFGQRPFTYTPPTGFVALNTYNLPTSTIVKGNTVMDATLWSGTGANQNIVNAAAFKPDFVWGKLRNGADQNFLVNSVAGATNYLVSNSTQPETADATTVVSLNSNGFTVGTSTNLNRSGGYNFVGWQWQAGQGSSSSNTNGTITSTVSVNASAGFSVVTYTGTGANATVGHGLGVAPAFYVVKARNYGSGGNWVAWHTSLGQPNALWMNLTNASFSYPTAFNSTNPTSSVISVGTAAEVNNSGSNFVAYCWTPIAGYSAFGSYTGNGSTDGPFVYLGFRPKFVMIKETGNAQDWVIHDTSRATYNADDYRLLANSSGAELNTGFPIDELSNGFKLRNAGNGTNRSGGTYIYMTFAENPFKNALAR